MCGLLLYLNKEEGVDLDSFQKALDLQESRGPDDYGIVCIKSLASKNLIDIKSISTPALNSTRLLPLKPPRRLTLVRKL